MTGAAAMMRPGRRVDWCTSAEVLERVRRCVGWIGLDPCSNRRSIVGATVEYRAGGLNRIAWKFDHHVVDTGARGDQGGAISSIPEAIVARAKTGQAISAARRTVEERLRLTLLLETAAAVGDLATWRRAKAVTAYMDGRRVVEVAAELGVGRSSVNTWLRAYETGGVEGLETGKSPGPPVRLTTEQQQELQQALEAGPQAAGFTSGVWTGPLVREYVFQHFGVGYHNHHLPRLLHRLGFSVQRPRKRLARADPEEQAVWMKDRLPAIKKSPGLPRRSPVRGRG